MNYREWARFRLGDIRENGSGGVKRAGHDVWERVLRTLWVTARPEYGTSVYDRDWDVLIVLDACPYTLISDVADEFDFLNSLELFESVGTGTRDWMTNTFVEPKDEYREEMAETTYINANPNSEDLLDSRDFAALDDVWRYGYDEDLFVTPPRVVTDRLIRTLRNDDPTDRVIAHYMQPHAPFLPHMKLIEHTSGEYEISIWKAVLRGRVSADRVWEAYRDNLRHVLEELELVLENVDADELAITSDHGNAMGEWGIYGHGGPPIAPLIEVPWVQVGETTDAQTHDPEFHRDERVGTSRESQLENLGYLT